MKNFWSKLDKPIYALAPMAGVADSAFRQICKDFGADVVYSEMVSATALAYHSKKTLELMKFAKKERPYVVQLFGAKPEHFAQAVKIVEKQIKPDGLDINFGCPVKKVQKQGAGAVLMNDMKLARRIVAAAIENTSLPVSIKIRSKVGNTTAVDFLKSLAGLEIKAVMIHGRSMAQGNSGEVDWKMIKRARPLVKGVLLANGGVGLTPSPSPSLERGVKADADWLLAKTGADGVGIGQGALGRPWIFQQLKIKNYQLRIKNADEKSRGAPPGASSKEEIFKVMLKHAKLAEKLKGQPGIVEMRKHLCWYVSGLPDAGALREKLVKAESSAQIKKIFYV
ncbi:MAG: tRNA-dihydrouridine synthase [Patescibacteria group bacterium]|nr:tRNA-dihydrouridine synthase [Patescibacteria group bacterium]